MARLKDENWNLPEGTRQADGSRTHTYDTIQVALLMDIRDELKRLNDLMHCHNTLAIPGLLRKIDKRLATKLPLRAGSTK